MNVNTPIPTVYGNFLEKFGALWSDQIKLIQEKFSTAIETVQMPGMNPTDLPIIYCVKSSMLDLLSFLKTDLDYNFLTDMTATDEGSDPRFELVFHLFSHQTKARIRIKVKISDGEKVPTTIPIWPGANWAEREIFDMFGIIFDGHPDLRRILMDQRWEGHPLRKDYPLRGYQVFMTPEPINPELLK